MQDLAGFRTFEKVNEIENRPLRFRNLRTQAVFSGARKSSEIRDRRHLLRTAKARKLVNSEIIGCLLNGAAPILKRRVPDAFTRWG